jgi:hypothetical protein
MVFIIRLMIKMVSMTKNEKYLALFFAFILIVNIIIGWRIDAHDQEVERLRIYNEETWILA